MFRRALLSVSDKTGIVELGRALADRGIALLSTGGTLAALREAGVPVVSVENYTGSPEVMGGRVKTLHPRVHGGILAREGRDDADLARLGAELIDLVVVNLYPFESTVARGAAEEEVIENIDIGGPSMLRSAAKNHARVLVVCDPADYAEVLDLGQDGASLDVRRRFAAKAFAHTAAYDGAIAAHLSSEVDGDAAAPSFPRYVTLQLERTASLRYGENPHQAAAAYRERAAPRGSLATAESIGAGGKELSFNNLVDLDAALELVRDFDGPTAAVIKHTNPSGLGTAGSLSEAYRLAREGDPVSAFGGIVALNRPCDAATALVLTETFIEGVVAPGFSVEALAILHAKKNLRVVRVAERDAPRGLESKRIGGGFVLQTADATARGEVRLGRVVTRRAPTPRELDALDVAWRAAKHVKSNAIVLARAEEDSACVVGVGAGQMSRVESVRLACKKAGERAQGSALGSDAFFPFPDGIQEAAASGVTALAQPGGSVKDSEVIAAADAFGLAMVFTSVRHFRH